jgi:hypothetical protein
MTVSAWLRRASRAFCALVFELSVVHELADGRSRHRGDLDEIQVRLCGQFEGLADRHDADLLALWAHETHLGHPDPVVDPRFGTDGTSLIGLSCGSSPKTTTAPLRVLRTEPMNYLADRITESAA